MQLTSKIEEDICRSFRSFLEEHKVNEMIYHIDYYPNFLVNLEWFIPTLLEKKYPDSWYPTLDGFKIHKALKTGDLEAWFLGMSWVIPDDALIPYYLLLRIDSAEDRIERLEFRIGEVGEQGFIRAYSNCWKRMDYLDVNETFWAFKVVYEKGEIT